MGERPEDRLCTRIRLRTHRKANLINVNFSQKALDTQECLGLNLDFAPHVP